MAAHSLQSLQKRGQGLQTTSPTPLPHNLRVKLQFGLPGDMGRPDSSYTYATDLTVNTRDILLLFASALYLHCVCLYLICEPLCRQQINLIINMPITHDIKTTTSNYQNYLLTMQHCWEILGPAIHMNAALTLVASWSIFADQAHPLTAWAATASP